MPDNGNVFRRIAEGASSDVLDLLGSPFEFLRRPDARGSACVARAVIPPGTTVPLHSHDDAEDFFVLAGSKQVLIQGVRGLEWVDVQAGDYVQVPPGARHAIRNLSPDPVVELVITSARLGEFFQEVARPAAASPRPPSPDDLARFVATVAKYGYTLGSPDENAEVGIQMPKFTASR